MHHTPTRRRLLVVAVSLSIALSVLAACGKSGEGTSGDSKPGRDTGIAAQPSSRSTQPTGSPTKPQQKRQLLTYSASLDVRVKDTDKAVTAAERLVTKSGGYVESQQLGGASTETMTTTFQVPTKRYRKAVDRLASLGTRKSLSQRTSNVTQQVADVDQRVKSATASLSRLRGLLQQAKSVREVLAVEEQISRREAELESLQAQQRTLDKQVAYASVTLTLDGPGTANKDRTGFLAGLQAGWRGFVAFLDAFVTAVGALLPFCIVLVPLGFCGYLLWRRRRRVVASRRASTPLPPQDAPRGGEPAG